MGKASKRRIRMAMSKHFLWMGTNDRRQMSNEDIDAICRHCGQALKTFLHEMEEHNAEVVCASCGKPQDSSGHGGAHKGAAGGGMHSHQANTPSAGNVQRDNPKPASSKRR
jgi:hypothetical protein